MSLKVAIRPFKWGIDQAFMLTQPTTTLIFSNYPGGGKANATSVTWRFCFLMILDQELKLFQAVLEKEVNLGGLDASLISKPL